MKSALILVLLSVVAASAFEQCGKKGNASRIPISWDAEDAGHGEFPWQISLRFGRYGHICGGTLIGNQYVLCAAHCFESIRHLRISHGSYTIRVGEWYLQRRDGTEKDCAVSEIHIHEKYNTPRQLNNDIALIKLAQPVDFSGPYVGPACLPPAGKDYRGAQNCIYSGWGLNTPQTHANRLRKLQGRIWTASALQGQYWYLPDHVVGFGVPGRWSACMGESGGPLVCPNGSGYDVIGITSFGHGTCSGKPGLFTEVSAYRSWLSAKSHGAV